MGKKLFSKPTTYLVIGLIVLWVALGIREAKAETVIEVAPVIAYGGDVHRGQIAALAFHRFQGKYEIGITLLMDDTNRLDGNRCVEASRVTSGKKWEAGLGVAYCANQSPAWDANMTFALLIGYNFNDRWAVRLRHKSTGGTSRYNAGMDLLTIGYSF